MDSTVHFISKDICLLTCRLKNDGAIFFFNLPPIKQVYFELLLHKVVVTYSRERLCAVVKSKQYGILELIPANKFDIKNTHIMMEKV